MHYSGLGRCGGADSISNILWKYWLSVPRMTGILIIYGAYIPSAVILGLPTGPVALVIHSEIGRPIVGFSVNGGAG